MSGVGRLLCSPAPHKAWGLLPTQPRAALTASTAPRLSYPHRLQLSGSMHASRSCLFPESQPSQHGTGPAWRYQQTDRILCFLHRVLGLQLSHSETLLLFLSLFPPLLSILSFPPFPSCFLSPAAMSPLLKSCHTHQDLPTSPPCPARQPALLIPCSRNCPVPADAGSKALVPCSNCTWCPFFVCRSGQVGTCSSSAISPCSSCHLTAPGWLPLLCVGGKS